jgi:hypothetical protein
MRFLRRRARSPQAVTVCESCARTCDQACRAAAGLDRLRAGLLGYPFAR